MLAEARAELDRAQVIGGPGRYTDQDIGSYHLDVLIGRGAMGEIYQARNTLTGADAAVKLLHPTALGDPMYVKRFLREAQAAASLVSPNVVRVFDIGTTDAEVPYIAMERLYGQDLATEIRTKGHLSLSEVRMLVSQIAVGLEAARLKEIVHRDLKPHNVFGITEGSARTWKILDFGVSKMNSSGTLTEGHIVGTPAYMAPEQARGQEVDHRADVYALAAIAFRALTGRPVYTGKDVPSTLHDVVYRGVPQPSKIRSLPADIDRVLAIGLAKNPDQRFATALELAEWLAAAVTDSLSDTQRRRADQLIALSPWDREL
jgi:serine/threonine-protein kinase